MTDPTDDEGFLPEEQKALGAIMFGFAEGSIEPLVEFLMRRKPISAGGAYLLGLLLREGLNGFTVNVKPPDGRRGAKGDSRSRAATAAMWVAWTTRRQMPANQHNPTLEESITRASRRFHVDNKAVRRWVTDFFIKFGPIRPSQFRRLLRNPK